MIKIETANYIRISKAAALKRYASGEAVRLAVRNCSPESLASVDISNAGGCNFNVAVNSFMYYAPAEFGRYPAFYAPRQEAAI